MVGTIWPWVIFHLFVFAMLALDLGVFHRQAHQVRLREAAIWSAVWVALSLLFALGLFYFQGQQESLQFLTGYLIEKALSVDNIFVFVLIFSYFSVPPKYQHRILFWGILGALLMRGVLIAVGAALVQQFHWVLYFFGAFLVFTGVRLAFHRESEIHPEANPVLRLVKRFFPLTHQEHEGRFWVREEVAGKVRWAMTPLFVVLILVETTDLVFALDSIPAIFAITQDPFLVYTSNIFAILGLRALYFLLAGIIHRFHYLKLGLSAVLVFVGVKMLIEHWWEIPVALSLGVVALLLGTSVAASLLFPRRAEARDPAPHAPPPAPPPPGQAEGEAPSS